MRCFVAIGIPDELKAAISACQKELRQFPSGVRWVDMASQHLTLKFLGEVAPAAASRIQEVLGPVAAETRPMKIRVQGVGAFPSLRRPRVFWMGVYDEEQGLADLARRVEAALEPQGFPREERAWHPHITLGRVKEPFGLKALGDYITMNLPNREAGEFTAEKMCLYRSILKPGGAVYEPLAYFGFAAG